MSTESSATLSNLSVIMMQSTTKDIHSVHDHHKGYFIITKVLQLSVLLSLPNSSKSSTNHGITFLEGVWHAQVWVIVN